MDNLKQYSDTQILKFMNNAERDHNDKKTVIKKILDENEELMKKYTEVVDELNKEVNHLDEIELRYVKLVEEYNSRSK